MCRKMSAPALFHSDTRHLLMNGIPIKYLSRWMGALVDTDDAHLPGACAGPDGESGVGAVTDNLKLKLSSKSLHTSTVIALTALP